MCPKCILLKSKLKEFRLSSHSFVVNVSSNGAPTFKLNAITVSSCQIDPTFPAWLPNTEILSILTSHS